ncbi:MAG: tRNA (uridine(34)/cytosine(34)/5-carboxymethylaminomethyluridine(34)-2'-O)-methyltransferase TrmL [Tepidanaerobacteraceae bacterium]|jgi:tRNA (cytidine/uridine-2'-O-)-methyltransferase|nr:tRNA (uridine(34)/cytosine(34)/5-carboxymethylaminomethyluridine(34)-2'-O)-methyltransferase TrmL [Tepidanaerobacteraceae bacterium]
MLHVVLLEPEIPQNTGNIARTCAATGSVLHLIGPLGFSIDDKHLKRAGLDYWSLLDIRYYESYEEFERQNPCEAKFFLTTKAKRCYTDANFTTSDCYLVFGKETAGLPKWLLDANAERCLRIPMIDDARSLNLSNSVAIVVYEALRQRGFPGLKIQGPSKA